MTTEVPTNGQLPIGKEKEHQRSAVIQDYEEDRSAHIDAGNSSRKGKKRSLFQRPGVIVAVAAARANPRIRTTSSAPNDAAHHSGERHRYERYDLLARSLGNGAVARSDGRLRYVKLSEYIVCRASPIRTWIRRKGNARYPIIEALLNTSCVSHRAQLSLRHDAPDSHRLGSVGSGRCNTAQAEQHHWPDHLSLGLRNA